MRASVSVSSGSMWTNCDDVQQAVQAPQGTAAAAPSRSAATMAASHGAKSPAGRWRPGAGENAAGRCAAGGLRTAVVERELVGGECSYWGCMPSKALLRPGDVIAAARRVPGAAAAVTGGIDVDAALAWRDSVAGHWDDAGQLPWLEERHVTLIRGSGRLVGERAVEVKAADGTVRRLTAGRAVVLATGTKPAVPPIPGLAEARPWDNRSVTATKDIPRRLLVLGGGAIGAE